MTDHADTIRRVNDLLRSLGNKRAADASDAALDELLNAMRDAMNELGVPDEGYLAPVANAYEILAAALGVKLT